MQVWSEFMTYKATPQLVHIKLVTIDIMGIAQSLFWRGVIGNWQLLSKMLFVDRKYTVHCFHDPIFQNQIENLNKTKIAENFIKRSKISNLLCCWSRHCLEVPVQNNMNCLGIKLYKMNYMKPGQKSSIFFYLDENRPRCVTGGLPTVKEEESQE